MSSIIDLDALPMVALTANGKHVLANGGAGTGESATDDDADLLTFNPLDEAHVAMSRPSFITGVTVKPTVLQFDSVKYEVDIVRRGQQTTKKILKGVTGQVGVGGEARPAQFLTLRANAGQFGGSTRQTPNAGRSEVYYARLPGFDLCFFNAFGLDLKHA